MLMKKIYLTALQATLLYPAALYLLGFGLSGVNINGAVDGWIPFERVLCLGLSAVFFVWFAVCCRNVVYAVSENKKK